MDLYSKMYAILCCAVSDALDVLPDNYQTLHSKLLLERGLWEAQELYLQECDPTDDVQYNIVHDTP